MNRTPTDPAMVLALAERYGWPRARLAPAASVGPGRDAWLRFVAMASPDRLAEAHAALLALPDNPPEAISPRLV